MHKCALLALASIEKKSRLTPHVMLCFSAPENRTWVEPVHALTNFFCYLRPWCDLRPSFSCLKHTS